MQPDQAPSLYDRLGGVYNIATVIDDLIDRVMTDPRLNKNPAVDEVVHQHHRTRQRHARRQTAPGSLAGDR